MPTSPAGLPVQEPAFSGPTSPFPVLHRAQELVGQNGETLSALNIDSQGVIQRIFAMLTQGDPQSALETYEALERLIDRRPRLRFPAL